MKNSIDNRTTQATDDYHARRKFLVVKMMILMIAFYDNKQYNLCGSSA